MSGPAERRPKLDQGLATGKPGRRLLQYLHCFAEQIQTVVPPVDQPGEVQHGPENPRRAPDADPPELLVDELQGTISVPEETSAKGSEAAVRIEEQVARPPLLLASHELEEIV